MRPGLLIAIKLNFYYNYQYRKNTVFSWLSKNIKKYCEKAVE